MIKGIIRDAKTVPMFSGPYWNMIGTLVYILAAGANLFSVGLRIAEGKDPTFNVVVVVIIIAIALFDTFLKWSTHFTRGKIQAYKEMRRL